MRNPKVSMSGVCSTGIASMDSDPAAIVSRSRSSCGYEAGSSSRAHSATTPIVSVQPSGP